MMNRKTCIEVIERTPARSAWERGVKAYAVEMLESIDNKTFEFGCETGELKCQFLDGVRGWYEYSYGGKSLIYDYDIAKRLCNNTELKRTAYGNKQPDWQETWLDVQARALCQAYRLIRWAIWGR